MLKKIEIFTDGASRGNPGSSGYGAILRFGKLEKEISQGFQHSTNQRMELMAVIEALKLLKTKKYPIVVYSDSRYVVDTIEKKWIDKWQKQNFAGRANADLWKAYLEVAKGFNIHFEWIKGHNKHPENERCDHLATSAAKGKNVLVDHGYVHPTMDSTSYGEIF